MTPKWAKIEPCSDHGCIFLAGQRRKGMGTNGGCKCVRNRPVETERFIRQQSQVIKHMLQAAASTERPAYDEQQRRIMQLEDEIAKLKGRPQ